MLRHLISVLLLCLIILSSRMIWAQSPVNASVAVDKDSLSIYIPGPNPVSLKDIYFAFQTTDTYKSSEITPFIKSYPSFTGVLNWGAVQTPVCFFLLRQGANASPPLNCQDAATNLLRQDLSVRDVFWYDPNTDQSLSFTVKDNVTDVSPVCGAGSSATCPMQVLPANGNSASPTATAILLQPVDNIPVVTANAQWKPQFKSFNGVDMALVPPGCFKMGSTTGDLDETPPTKTCITQPFWIDKTLVTQGQFAQFNGQADKESYYKGDKRPVEQINWFEATAFCQQRGARLLTEEEWEYAARGPDSLPYPWGKNFDGSKLVWNRGLRTGTANVGSIPAGASWVGGLDIMGNLWEWVSTIYKPYPYDPNDGRESTTDTTNLRGLRGGSWYDHNDALGALRASYRGAIEPDQAGPAAGFRCALSYTQ